MRDRQFLLQPNKVVNDVVLYALGVALSRHKVQLFAFMAEANHIHANLTDSDSTEASALPDFFRDFHALVARALNAHYGRGENFWATPGSYDNVEVHDQRTLEEQLLYTWTNPVKDGLVERPEDWEGIRFLPEDFGRTITVKRPESAFFGGRRPQGWEPTHSPARRAYPVRPGARPPKQPAPKPERDRRRLPESVTFTIAPPPGYEHMPIEEVRAHFRRLLDERVAWIRAERERTGLRFKGVEAVREQNPLATAGGTSPSFGRRPRIACLEREARVALLMGLAVWRGEYRVALEGWRAGNRSVRFPRGSYAMVRWHAALAVVESGLT